MGAVKLLRCISAAALAWSLGCGGTGDDGGANGTLALAKTEPADGASGVATDVVVVAQFDAPLSEASVTPNSFRVTRDDGTEVQGTLSVAGDTARFTPTQTLALLHAYTVTLTTEIEALSGQILEPSRSWRFSTRDGTWSQPVLVEINNAGSASSPRVAVDANGNAIVVWAQSDGARLNIWSNRFTSGEGWGEAQLIETDDAGDANEPEVAVDANGNAIAVWEQFDGIRVNVWANRFTPAEGWGDARPIEIDDAGDSFDAAVAVDPDGNAIAVWVATHAGRADIVANRFVPTEGWGAVELIEMDNAGDAYEPDAAIGPNGDAIAVWTQSDGAHYNIWANQFTPTRGWGIPIRVEAIGGDDAGYPQVAVDRSGNATAIWEQLEGAEYHIWSGRFTPAGGWSVAGLVQLGNVADAHYPQIALDFEGRGVAVWQQWDGVEYHVWANRFAPADGWGKAGLIQADETGDSSGVEVTVGPDGNAVAVWQQSDGTRDGIWANRFTSTEGWATAERIESDDAGNANTPAVAADPSGNAMVVWQQQDGARFNIWASRFE